MYSKRVHLVNRATCHDDVRKRGGIIPTFLDFGTKWRRILRIIPPQIYTLEKIPRHSLDRKMGGYQCGTK
jgi:hypothetical protein